MHLKLTGLFAVTVILNTLAIAQSNQPTSDEQAVNHEWKAVADVFNTDK